MRVAVGANSRGMVFRDQVVQVLAQLGHEVDVGKAPEGQPAEFPEMAAAVARQVQQGTAARGILLGRTGMGMCMVANKFRGVRAAVCFDELMAEESRRHLDVNVLCLSADLLGGRVIEGIVRTWMKTEFEGGRHAPRIERIVVLEAERSSGG